MKGFVFDEYKNRLSTPEFTTALNKFNQGDGVDDSELEMLLSFYRHALACLEALGEKFGLAADRVRSDLSQLKQFQYHRNFR